MNRKAGLTLVEIMVVLCISIIIMIPTMNFLVGTTKWSYKGYDRLVNLNTARFILEKCSRDLKFFCGNASFPAILVQTDGDVQTYVFPVFPNEGYGVELETASNPVNFVAYTFDPKMQTLHRRVITQKQMIGTNLPERTQELGKNVMEFCISALPLWGNFCQIRVKCQGSHPQREEIVELQTAVRSVFGTRSFHHYFQVPNEFSSLDFPNQ